VTEPFHADLATSSSRSRVLDSLVRPRFPSFICLLQKVFSASSSSDSFSSAMVAGGCASTNSRWAVTNSVKTDQLLEKVVVRSDTKPARTPHTDVFSTSSAAAAAAASACSLASTSN